MEESKIIQEQEICKICFEEEILIENKCGCKFCQTCYASNIKFNLDNNIVEIKCFAEECNQFIEKSIIEQLVIINSQQYQRQFKRAATQELILRKNGFRCPGIDCQEIFFPNEYVQIFSAHTKCKCGTIFCTKKSCSTEFHYPASCEQIETFKQAITQEDKSIYDIANDKKIKTCPFCFMKFQRSLGCNMLTCFPIRGGCGKTFCHECEQDWEGHQSHYQCTKPKQISESKPVINSKIESFFRYQKEMERKLEISDQFRKISQINCGQFEKDLMETLQIPIEKTIFYSDTIKVLEFMNKLMAYCQIQLFFIGEKQQAGSQLNQFEICYNKLKTIFDQGMQVFQEFNFWFILQKEGSMQNIFSMGMEEQIFYDDETVFRIHRNEIISAMKELMAEFKYIKQIYGFDD